MSRLRALVDVLAGAALAALLVTAVNQARAAGEEPSPQPTVEAAPKVKPAAAQPRVVPVPSTPIAGSPAPAAWTRSRGPSVTSGVIARAARRAQERDTAAPPPSPEKRRPAKPRGEGTIISVEIDWNATPAP